MHSRGSVVRGPWSRRSAGSAGCKKSVRRFTVHLKRGGGGARGRRAPLDRLSSEVRETEIFRSSMRACAGRYAVY
jgi:hypothetical protein